jgi:hypothetical protein
MPLWLRERGVFSSFSLFPNIECETSADTPLLARDLLHTPPCKLQIDETNREQQRG